MSPMYITFCMLHTSERFQFCNSYVNSKISINEKISAQSYRAPNGNEYFASSVAGVKIVI